MDIMRKALEQARQGRMHILGKMAETLGTSRADISTFAPRIITIKIPVEKIRERIGSGGKTIRSIVERTGVKIDVEDDGRINIASSDDVAAQKAISIIQELTATPELDKVYMGSVQRITDFGAFIDAGCGRSAARLRDGQLPRGQRARRAEGRRAGRGQGDQH